MTTKTTTHLRRTATVTSHARRAVIDTPGCPQPQQGYNVIKVMLDDGGMEWFSMYAAAVGGSNQWSPGQFDYPRSSFLDAQEGRGVVFDYYYASPVCSPTRAQILTGRYPHIRDGKPGGTGIGSVVNEGSPAKLEASHQPLGHVIRAVSGRPTLLEGKYHLGDGRSDLTAPCRDAGFDRYEGLITNPNVENQGPESSPPYSSTGDYYNYWQNVCEFDVQESASESYTLDGDFLSTTEAKGVIAWIESLAEEQTFFATLWLHSAHSIIDPVDDDAGVSGEQITAEFDYLEQAPLATAPDGTGDPEYPCSVLYRRFHAHIEAMDALLSSINLSMTVEQRQRTIWIFTTDNGTASTVMTSYPDEHYGPGEKLPPPDVYDQNHFKGTLHEQGIHVPLLISGFPLAAEVQGTRSQQIVDSVDLYPTILDIVAPGWREHLESQDDLELVDGVSLIPCLTSPDGLTTRTHSLSQHFTPNGATVGNYTSADYGITNQRRWKLMIVDDVESLFYLGGVGGVAYGESADPNEATDILTAGPQGGDPDSVSDEYVDLKGFYQQEVLGDDGPVTPPVFP